MSLSILCVTRGEDYALPQIVHMREVADMVGAELVLVQDGDTLADWATALADKAVAIKSAGYIESILDAAIAETSGDYVLRLDDDETCPELAGWLMKGGHLSADHWSFARKHLWQDGYYISSAPLYPDLQTRLSVRAKAGGRNTLHVGSPFGAGNTAPVAIWHHKFRLKSPATRRKIAASYDEVIDGGGTGNWMAFNLPEDYYKSGEMKLEALWPQE